MIDYVYALEQLNLSREYMQKVLEKLAHNDLLFQYFKDLYNETNKIDYSKLSDNIKFCNSNWFMKRYDVPKIFDIQSINNCHSKFCSNCQKLIQASRLSKMTPHIESSVVTYDLYHLILTVPNVKSLELKSIISIMFEAFQKLIKYFDGRNKMEDMDFEFIGYSSAMKSLEITYKENGEYHPHIHCILALKKDLEFVKDKVNDYSFNRGIFERYFSDFEIRIQKIWFLLINNIIQRNQKIKIAKYNHNTNLSKLKNPIDVFKSFDELLNFKVSVMPFESAKPNYKQTPKDFNIKALKVTKQAIDKINIGYSCVMDKVDDNNYYEVFKYAFKLTSDEDSLLNYEQFKTLFFTTRHLRQVQCYGAWYKIKIDDSINMDTATALYMAVIEELSKNDKPVNVNLTLQKTLGYVDDLGYKVISKRKIYQYIKLLDEAEKYESLEDIHKFIDIIKYAKIDAFTQRTSGVKNSRGAIIPTVQQIEKLKAEQKAFAESEYRYDKDYEKIIQSRPIHENVQLNIDDIF